MTETSAPPSKLAHVVSKGISLAETGVKKVAGIVAPPVTAVLHAAATVTGLKLAWSTLVLLCRNPSSWLIIVPILAGVYLWGHAEEAHKAKAVFNQLSSCVANLNAAKAVKAPSCSAVAPAPAAEAPAPASADTKAPVSHRKKKAATSSWW